MSLRHYPEGYLEGIFKFKDPETAPAFQYVYTYIVNNFEKATGVKVKYEIVDRRPGDIAECYADPTKAEFELGWKAEKNLEEMCKDSWRFTENNK